jgi:uncharacterized protein YndB with AHSA1/START domain
MTAEKITISAIINVAKTKVWDYYTLPEHITKWNFADPSWHCPSATNDMKIGGKYLARMEAKDGSFGFDFEAYYTSIHPSENFTYEFDGRTVIVAFNDNNTSTEVIISFDPETEHPIELQKNGWQAILNNFKKYCEQI